MLIKSSLRMQLFHYLYKSCNIVQFFIKAKYVWFSAFRQSYVSWNSVSKHFSNSSLKCLFVSRKVTVGSHTSSGFILHQASNKVWLKTNAKSECKIRDEKIIWFAVNSRNYLKIQTRNVCKIFWIKHKKEESQI